MSLNYDLLFMSDDEKKKAKEERLRGNGLRKAKKWDEAIEAYTKAIELDKESAWAWYRRALCRWNCGKNEYDLMISDCSEATRMRPELAVAFNLRGRARRRKVEYALAIADCAEAIRLKPKTSLFFHNLGDCRVLLGDDDGALEDDSGAIRLNPKYAKALSGRALVYLKRKMYDLAHSDLSKAMTLRSDCIDFFRRAFVSRARGDIVKARSDFSVVVKAEVGNYSFGYCLRTVAKWIEAVAEKDLLVAFEKDATPWVFKEEMQRIPQIIPIVESLLQYLNPSEMKTALEKAVAAAITDGALAISGLLEEFKNIYKLYVSDSPCVNSLLLRSPSHDDLRIPKIAMETCCALPSSMLGGSAEAALTSAFDGKRIEAEQLLWLSLGVLRVDFSKKVLVDYYAVFQQLRMPSHCYALTSIVASLSLDELVHVFVRCAELLEQPGSGLRTTTFNHALTQCCLGAIISHRQSLTKDPANRHLLDLLDPIARTVRDEDIDSDLWKGNGDVADACCSAEELEVEKYGDWIAARKFAMIRSHMMTKLGEDRQKTANVVLQSEDGGQELVHLEVLVSQPQDLFLKKIKSGGPKVRLTEVPRPVLELDIPTASALAVIVELLYHRRVKGDFKSLVLAWKYLLNLDKMELAGILSARIHLHSVRFAEAGCLLEEVTKVSRWFGSDTDTAASRTTHLQHGAFMWVRDDRVAEGWLSSKQYDELMTGNLHFLLDLWIRFRESADAMAILNERIQHAVRKALAVPDVEEVEKVLLRAAETFATHDLIEKARGVFSHGDLIAPAEYDRLVSSESLNQLLILWAKYCDISDIRASLEKRMGALFKFSDFRSSFRECGDVFASHHGLDERVKSVFCGEKSNHPFHSDFKYESAVESAVMVFQIASQGDQIKSQAEEIKAQDLRIGAQDEQAKLREARILLQADRIKSQDDEIKLLKEDAMRRDERILSQAERLLYLTQVLTSRIEGLEKKKSEEHVDDGSVGRSGGSRDD